MEVVLRANLSKHVMNLEKREEAAPLDLGSLDRLKRVSGVFLIKGKEAFGSRPKYNLESYPSLGSKDCLVALISEPGSTVVRTIYTHEQLKKHLEDMNRYRAFGYRISMEWAILSVESLKSKL